VTSYRQDQDGIVATTLEIARVGVEQPARDSLKLDVRCRDLGLSGMGRRTRLTAGGTTLDLPMRVHFW
jgi:hypothetical protein